MSTMKPHEIVAELDKYVIGQEKAKRMVAVAIRNRWRRQQLPEELREVARLRLENPDMSLRELGETMDPPLSRSGINHRLRRIVEHADKLP